MAKETEFKEGSKNAPFCGDHGCDPNNYMLPHHDPFFRPKNKRNFGKGWANYGQTGSLVDSIQSSCYSDANEDDAWEKISDSSKNLSSPE